MLSRRTRYKHRKAIRRIVTLAAMGVIGFGALAGLRALFSTSTETHVVNAAALNRKTVARVVTVKPDPPPMPPPTAPKPAVHAAAVSNVPAPTGYDGLQAQILQLFKKYKVDGGVALIELGGAHAGSWNLDGAEVFTAASTYKEPLLMMDTQRVVTGKASATDKICFQNGDYEPGYYGDYGVGACFQRKDLEYRVGHFSDNTAAHMLTRDNGGAGALNAFAKTNGAIGSAFFKPNTTTASDLANLWKSEYSGKLGGVAAHNYLYPILTHTYYEAGIPAGVPKSVQVVHKIGIVGSYLNDSALVLGGPKGDYILAICTKGGSWPVLAQVSKLVWNFEVAR